MVREVKLCYRDGSLKKKKTTKKPYEMKLYYEIIVESSKYYNEKKYRFLGGLLLVIFHYTIHNKEPISSHLYFVSYGTNSHIIVVFNSQFQTQFHINS